VHLAAAWKIPMVGLFPETPDLVPWYPYHSSYRAVHAATVPDIPVIAVEDALRSLVAEQFPDGAAG
jgi:ADP-heptose:LPS heptosyltransferase